MKGKRQMINIASKRVIDMVECVKREVKMRERVYPRWVSAGKMTQKKADFELDTMRNVLEHLQDYLKEFDIEEENDKQGSLFDDKYYFCGF